MIYANWMQWSEVQSFHFLTTTRLFLIFFCLTFSGTSYVSYSIPVPDRGWWLTGGRPKKCLHASQMSDLFRIANDWRTTPAFEECVAEPACMQNTVVTSILYSLNGATHDWNSNMLWLCFISPTDTILKFGSEHNRYLQMIQNLFHFLFGYWVTP